MKKYLFIALAAFGLVACTDNWNDPNSPNFKGELEESYIAINLMSADINSRAAEDTYGYEDGTTEERAIHKAYFFFFDENGDPFNVTASAPGGDKNHLQLTIGNTTGNVDPNVSDIKEAVLVLNTYKGVYPSKIVAVLNWVPTDNTYTLASLHEVVENSLGNETYGFVMSNSVYMDGANQIVDAVPLTAANIKTTADAAKNAPVEIYVERTAAKVFLTASGKVAGTTNIFDTQKNSTPILSAGNSSEIDVFVQLHGWELYNDYTTTNLLKNIEHWDNNVLGLTWNDSPFFRCYWANSRNDDPNDSFSWSYSDFTAKGLHTQYGFNIATDTNYTVGTYAYCGENTNQVVKNSEGKVTLDPRTKVILKGQLMQKNGENYEPLELARWYGTEYAGNQALRIAVANSLKYTLYYKDGEQYVAIKPEHLQCVEGTDVGAEAYEVGFQLSTDGQAKTWYQYSSAKGYQVLGNTSVAGDNIAKTNEYLKSVEPALLYSEGHTYYTVDIRHLGPNVLKPTYYGIVRNHVYKIDIETIKGYGSPVYIGTSNIETPDHPTEEDASYVAARINVLSWKVVKQGVNIEQ